MKSNIIRQIYFYAASLITLIIMVVASGQIVNTGLKSTLFPKADRAYKATCNDEGLRGYGNEPRMIAEKPLPVEEGASEKVELTDEEKAERKAECEENLAEERSAELQRELVNNLSMLIVSAPVFWFHFRVVQRERKEDKEEAKKTA